MNDTYDEGFGAGYAQAIGDADTALQKQGDDRTIRHCRQAVLALVEVPFEPDHVMPHPDWAKYRVPAVRDYPKPQVLSLEQGSISDRLSNFDDWGDRIRDRS
jgi:hypothetical protein